MTETDFLQIKFKLHLTKNKQITINL